MIKIDAQIIDMADVYGLNTEFTKSEYSALRKQNLNGLLNSYADEADVFAEIIQNAFDTIQICIGQQKYNSNVQPLIKIFVGRRSNDTHYFAVSDNGLGMDNETMNKFTIPGFTKHKKRGKTIGYKGVGASFFFASSQKISIRTIDVKKQVSSMTVKGSYAWIMNETEPEPTVLDEEDFPTAVTENTNKEQGTTICYYFHNGGNPKNLNNVVTTEDTKDKELSNWISFLCSKTALGQTTDISKQNIKVLFFLDDGNILTTSSWTFKDYNKDAKTLGYPYPWRVFTGYIEKSAIENVGKNNPGQLTRFLNASQAIHAVWTKKQIEDMNLTDNPDEQALINAHFESADVFLCWSTEIMKEIDKRIGARKSVVRYGIKLAVDNVPQGRMIDFDITSDIGLTRQTHLVMSFKELKLDDGRKIASDENIQEVIRKISVRIMGIIEKDRIYLRKRERLPFAEDLVNWKNAITAQATNSIVRNLFEKLALIPPIHIDPNSEHDVIALFVSLISNKLLKGYKLFSISGFNRYDGLINIYKSEELRKTDDRFSIRDAQRIQEGNLQVVEFKQVFADLINNFQKKIKFPNEVNLAVCWSLPEISQNLGDITFCYDTQKDHRPLYGVTHIWTHEHLTIPIISLQHFIADYLSYLESKEGIPGAGTSLLAELVQKDTDYSI